MKKIYNRPKMKVVRLLAAESLMNASDGNTLDFKATTSTAVGTHSLSNEESEHDIWGNSDNGIW